MQQQITADQLPKLLRMLAEANSKAAKLAAYEAASRGIEPVAEDTPVDTGLLKDSWDAKKIAEGAQLRNDCPYAVIQEMGSRPHGNHPGNPPRHMLLNNLPKLRQFYADAMREQLKAVR